MKVPAGLLGLIAILAVLYAASGLFKRLCRLYVHSQRGHLSGDAQQDDQRRRGADLYHRQSYVDRKRSSKDRGWSKERPEIWQKSVSLAAVVDVSYDDATRLIEAEEDTPLADAQSIAAFHRALQRFDVAATCGRERLQGADNAFCIGAVHVIEFALGGGLI